MEAAHLFGVGDEVDGRVMTIILLYKAESELIVDEEAVCR